MKLEMINVDKICEKLQPVTSNKDFRNGKFSRDGLFSPQIFGPIKSYKCLCGRLNGKSYEGKRCETCGVECISSSSRRNRYAKIKLPFEILNPLFYFLISKSRMSAKSIIDNMMTYKKVYEFAEQEIEQDNSEYIYIDKNEVDFDNIEIIKKENVKIDLVEVKSPNIENNERYLEGLDGVLKYIDRIYKNSEILFLNKLDNKKYKTSSDEIINYLIVNDDKKTIKNVIVLQPSFRPCNRNSTGIYISDEINRIYMNILTRVSLINNIHVEYNKTDDIFKINFKHLYNSILELYNYIFEKMSKKNGLIRSNILGKRLDFSGRAVIAPDPQLSLDECKIPYLMLLEILKPELTTYLVNRRVTKRYNIASKIIDQCIKDHDLKLFDYVTDFCFENDKVCILNRQPTLHRLGVLGFRIIPHDANVIKIHPLCCPPYNADFDGDAMAIYIPIIDSAKDDVLDKILILNNLRSPANGEITTMPNQDIILGLYSLTKDTNSPKVQYHMKTPGEKNKHVEMITKGQVDFNEALPEGIRYIRSEVDKDTLKAYLNAISTSYDPVTLANTLDNLKVLGFQESTKEGYTLGIKDIYDPELIKLTDNLTGDYQKDLEYINKNTELKEKLVNLPFSIFIESGARGSWQQAKQLVFARGYVANHLNQIQPYVIKSSMTTGLTPQEFFISSYGARKGLLDTALTTGESGYLTRQLVYSTHFVELDEDLNDCGTNEYLIMKIELGKEDLEIRKAFGELIPPEEENSRKINKISSNRLARSIVGRWYCDVDENNKIISEEKFINNDLEAIKLVGKTIALRSPIYCKGKKICKKCYGNLYKLINSNKIGIIAAHSLSERLTQLVLRTFHLSGVATQSSSTKSGGNEDIISGMGMVGNLFHSPGKWIPPTHPHLMVLKLFDLFASYGSIYCVHFETIVSAMLWHNSKLWRTQKNRNINELNWESILKIPSLQSWLVGSAFSNLKTQLLDGLVKNRVDEESALSSLFRF